MLPWSVGRVTDLPANAKLCKMQQNADLLVQLIGAATKDVSNPFQSAHRHISGNTQRINTQRNTKAKA